MRLFLLAAPCRAECRLFAEVFFKHYREHEEPAFHRELFDLLQSESVSRLAIAAPRGHAKSTIVSLIYVLWEALRGRRKFIVLVGNSTTAATRLLEHIRAELETNELLRVAFGNQEPIRANDEKWNQSTLVMRNGCEILAVGKQEKIRGIRNAEQRPDLVIVDDLEDDEHVRSKDQRERDKGALARIIEPMTDSRGRIVVVGTVLHPYSLMSELVSAEHWTAYAKRRFKAIQDDGAALWPARYDLEWLEQRKRDIGSFAFACEYQNEPVNEETKMFRRDWLQFYDELPAGLDYYAGTDPSIGEREQSDFFVCLTVGVDRASGDIYIADIYRARATMEAHTAAMIARHKQFNWIRVNFESVAFQRIMRQAIGDRAAAQGCYLPLRGIEAKGEKYQRIQRMQPLFEQGRIRIRRNMIDFIEEYDCYPSVDHDDQLDALDMAMQAVKHGRLVAGGTDE